MERVTVRLRDETIEELETLAKHLTEVSVKKKTIKASQIIRYAVYILLENQRSSQTAMSDDERLHFIEYLKMKDYQPKAFDINENFIKNATKHFEAEDQAIKDLDSE